VTAQLVPRDTDALSLELRNLANGPIMVGVRQMAELLEPSAEHGDALHRDKTSVWMGAFLLVQPVTFLLSAVAAIGGCIVVLILGLGNALLLALAFVVGALMWLVPGIVIYLLTGWLRNGLRVQATWDWLSIPLYLCSVSITVLSGLARLAEAFQWTSFRLALGPLIVLIAVIFWIAALFGGLLGALRN
jgi:hypothetical protein